MKNQLYLCVVAAVICCVYGWGRGNGISSYSRTPPRQEFKCSDEGQLCFQKSQCCDGMVCASPNRYSGSNFRKSLGYCQPQPDDSDNGLNDLSALAGLGQRGELCQDSTDCSARDALCCQNVTVFRRGSVRICDKITGISKCIKPNDARNEVLQKRK